MRVAVTTENNQVFQHFGKCQLFTIAEVEDGKLLSTSFLDANGSGHSALAVLLKQQGVDLLICGGIGQGAKDALAAQGVQLICGVSGSVSDVLAAYLNNTLQPNNAFVCDHHHHEGDSHTCHCGEH